MIIKVSGQLPFPLPAVIVVNVVTAILTITASYALDVHWRRSFRLDLDLRAAHEQQRLTLEKLSEAYAHLKETQDKLVQAEKTAALSRLVANLAHRLNTPIGNVMAATTYIDHSLKDFREATNSSPVRRSQLSAFLTAIDEGNAVLVENAHRTAGLIDIFKHLATETREPPDLTDLGELIPSLRPALEAIKPPQVKLVIEASPGKEVMAHLHVLEALTSELVRNAFTHAFPNGRPGQVTLRTRTADDGGIELQVCDNGVGIAPQHQEHVFDPFYTNGTVGGGNGLGLSIAHHAVKNMLGGRINLTSCQEQGTVVTVWLSGSSGNADENARHVSDAIVALQAA